MLGRVLMLQMQSLQGSGDTISHGADREAPLHDSVRILLSEVRETGSTVMDMRDTCGTLQLTQGSMLHQP